MKFWTSKVGELAQFLALLCDTMGRIYDTYIIFNPPTHLFFHPILLTTSHL
jgi:hypothetical protein